MGLDATIGKVGGAADAGSVEDLTGVLGKYLERMGVADGFGETNKKGRDLRRIGREARFITLDVDRHAEGHKSDEADVGGLAGEFLKGRGVVEGGDGHTVADVNDILECEQPFVSVGAGGIHHKVCAVFDDLPHAFSEVLVLIVGFTLPVVDVKGAEYIEDALADFDAGAVTDEFVHGTAFADDILKGVDKLSFGLEGVNVSDKGMAADEKLGSFDATGVDGGGVGINRVGGNRFMATEDVAGGERGAVGIADVGAGENVAVILGGRSKGLLDTVFGAIEEARAEAIVGGAVDGAFGAGNMEAAAGGDGIIIGSVVVVVRVMNEWVVNVREGVTIRVAIL